LFNILKMLPSLVIEISNPELYALFIQQLKKDFDTSNVNTDFIADLEPDYDLIFRIINSELQNLLNDSKFKLNQLLYRIDISEQQINKLSKVKPSSSFIEIISELIIKRVLQKVVIKEAHKNTRKKLD